MKIIALDNSMLGLVTRCSTKAVLTLLKYQSKKPNGALQVGTLFHHAVANYLSGMEAVSVESTFIEEYEAQRGAFDAWLFMDEHLGEKPQYEIDNLRIILKEWLARHPDFTQFIPGLNIPREWVEINFELPLGEKFKIGKEWYLLVITGQLDALGEEGDELWTVETKTVSGIKPWWKLKFEGDSQNTEYSWAAEQTTGREVIGTYLNAISTAHVPDSTRTCYKHLYADLPQDHEPGNKHSKDHPMYSECGFLHVETEVFPITREPNAVEQWKKDTIYWAKKFVELWAQAGKGIIGATKTRTTGKFNETCLFCDYREWCIRGARDPERAASMMGVNTEVRDVRVGIFEEEAFYAKAK